MTGDSGVEAYLESVKWLREAEVTGKDCPECGRFIPDGDVPPGPLHAVACSQYDANAWTTP